MKAERPDFGDFRFSGLAGPRYARLDLRDPASQYPRRGNRMAAVARLMFAESPFHAIHVLEERGMKDWAQAPTTILATGMTIAS